MMLISVVRSQSLPSACEASEETDALIEAWQRVYNDTRIDLPDRLEPLRKAIAAHPDDIFLHHRYQDYFGSYMTAILAGPEVIRYRDALSKAPESDLRQYLLGRILWGRSTAEGFGLIKGVVQRNPEFPWAHLTLARYYEHPTLRDDRARDREIGAFARICPASLDPQPYSQFFFGTQSPQFRAAASSALRARLQSLSTRQAMKSYGPLWEMEFQRPAAEHPTVRAQIARDLTRIRERATYSVYPVLLQGYEIVEDRENGRWVREQVQKEAPWSLLAREIVLRRWFQDRLD